MSGLIPSLLTLIQRPDEVSPRFSFTIYLAILLVFLILSFMALVILKFNLAHDYTIDIDEDEAKDLITVASDREIQKNPQPSLLYLLRFPLICTPITFNLTLALPVHVLTYTTPPQSRVDPLSPHLFPKVR